MKIIEYHGGLGNQIFEYVYYQYLKTLFPNEKFFSYCPKKAVRVHYGLEINKWFDVELAPSSSFTNLIGFLSYYGIRILKRLKIRLPWVSDDFHMSDNKLYHEGWYQNKKYFVKVGGPEFKKKMDIGEENQSILNLMLSTNSVSIHIRRGDYLERKNMESVGGICTKEYYMKAINVIKEKVESPIFLFFSDDPLFVEQNFRLPNMIIVKNNTGNKSFFDMYLMAHAQNMILANSTFSCWAAYLNKNAKNIIAPNNWNNKMNIDLNLHNWITLPT